MHLFVTGAAGFIGSNFVEWYLSEHPEGRVTAFDKLTYAGNPLNLATVQEHPGFRFVQGDIADEKAVREALAGCDAIINFAAASHVDRSLQNPGEFVLTNTMGVAVLLNVARELGIERMAQVGTDEVYGPILNGSATEDSPLRPANPYSASKAGGDLLALSYVNSFGANVVVTRGANTIGPRQYLEKVVPLFITNAIDDQPLPIYGTGRAVREYQYATDHCRGIFTALVKGKPGEIYNVGAGTQSERNTLQIAQAILQRLGKPESLINHVKDRPGHDMRYSIDNAKLRGLGWEPEYDFDSTMDATVKWYVENEAWWRPLKSGHYWKDYYRRTYGAEPGVG